jgi:tetraacyldisaccharide 4'-kinase
MFRLLSKIYEFGIRKRNASYDSRQSQIYRADIPVISIGNLIAGGSGKTPIVKLVAEKLIGMGRKPAIVGRGYKKRIKGMVFVSDGININYTAEDCGDEMYMLAQALHIPVISHEVKYEAAMKAQEIFDIDSIIVDDGFQHRMLFRDLDILLIDNNTINQKNLLPKGLLREPFESAKRAGLLGIKHDIDENILLDYKFLNNIPYFIYRYKMLRVCKLNSSTISNDELISLKKGAVAVSGIANPGGFESYLVDDGYKIIKHLAFKDHFRYNQNSIEKIIKECLAYNLINIITTEKDAVKLKNFSEIFDKNEINVYVLPIIVSIEKGEEILVKRINVLFGNKI